MADHGLTALSGAIIFTGDAFVEGHNLLVSGGKVQDIVAAGRVPVGVETVNYADTILAPGFIDCQVNGGGNHFLNSSPTAETAIAIAEAHARRGTTRLLPTCITDQPDVMKSAIKAVETARMACGNILGIHLEGPHLSLERRGVHHADYVRDMSAEDLSLYHPAGDGVMMMTVAPERVTAAQIRQLQQQGVIVSLGHTGADANTVRAALTAGATGFTHLFNGMGGLNAREPGPAGVALDDRDSWCNLIADGFHVSAEMIRLALRAKPEKVFLVSDAMPPAASDGPLPFTLYGETIKADGISCRRMDGKFAGAAITLADAVRHCIDKVGVEPTEALRMASTYPANFLGLQKKFGKLLPGYCADVVALNHQFAVQSVWVDGMRI